jgi:glycosyltransferase involved in cell wall biosynthesis
MRVALIDSVAGGHHAQYAHWIALHLRKSGHEVLAVGPHAWCAALANVAVALPVSVDAPASSRYFDRQAHQAQLFARTLEASSAAGADVAHVLYLDGAIAALLRTRVPAGLRVCATMHWYRFLLAGAWSPRSVVRALHYALGLRRLDRAKIQLIVHSRVAKRRLDRLGLTQVHAIDYPNVIPHAGTDVATRDACRSRLGASPTDRLLLCFGGTRRDKGVDLAIAALAQGQSNLKLLIAGAEQDFDRAALLGLARSHGVEHQIVLQLGHIADAEIFELFCAADAVLLPYRSMFSGQSGPLVIAGALGVPVIAADVPVMAETVSTFSLGRLFRAGRVAALARAMRDPLPGIDPQMHTRFSRASDPSTFGARHESIYASVRSSP